METKITAVIVEDEYKVRKVFVDLIGKFCPEIEIIGEAENIDEGYNLIVKTNPMLVFLDIEMPGGNGFELLAKFENPSFETIFVTSYGHYAINAIKYSALDYMLKPVMIDEIKQIPKRFNSKREVKHYAEQYKLLRENLTEKHQKLMINNKTKLEYVNLDEIVYLRADGNYTIIFLENDHKHHVSKTLKEYDEILCNKNNSFIRIHKTYIINSSYIDHLEKGLGTSLLLKNGLRLDVSRRKKQELLAKLESNSKINPD